MGNFSFKDKVVVITGASAGIGKALALQLSERKAKLAIGARNIEKLEEVAVQCRKNGAEVIAVSVDVAQENSCKNFIDKTVETYGGIDILVNNAGITMWAYFEDIKKNGNFAQHNANKLYGKRLLYSLCTTLPKKEQRAHRCRVEFNRQIGSSHTLGICCQQTCHGGIFRHFKN